MISREFVLHAKLYALTKPKSFHVAYIQKNNTKKYFKIYKNIQSQSREMTLSTVCRDYS